MKIHFHSGTVAEISQDSANKLAKALSKMNSNSPRLVTILTGEDVDLVLDLNNILFITK